MTKQSGIDFLKFLHKLEQDFSLNLFETDKQKLVEQIRVKFLENYQIKEIDGILTPYKLKMELANGKGKTELILKGLKYNIGIDSAKFRKEALR